MNPDSTKSLIALLTVLYGVLLDDECVGDCYGIGRHNAVQMIQVDGKWVKYTDTAEGANALGHIDMNRCFPSDANGSFYARTSQSSSKDRRNYTGKYAMMAKEAYALSELINTYKDRSGTKYFIDIHGWTQQIIFKGDINESPFIKSFYNHGFNDNSRDATLGGINARGYVARYALELGYQACLFEFPDDTIATDFNNGKYKDYFIDSIKYLIGI